ncbi:hypothetical protein WDU94_012174 [Cyamophila willieti]
MGRGLRELLSATLHDIEVTASIYPNGKFEQCLENAEQICSGLTKQDFVYIMCGTNNTCTLPPNSCPRLDLTPIRNIQKWTNVIVSSILYRHDSLSLQNINICYTNEYLEKKCQGLNVNFLQCNAFVKRRHFTRHGLHLNIAGKRVICAGCTRIEPGTFFFSGKIDKKLRRSHTELSPVYLLSLPDGRFTIIPIHVSTIYIYNSTYRKGS